MDTTTVVNVKVANIRPRYHSLKEWMDDDNNIYIGRAGVVFVDGKRFPPVSSPFANPFKIGKDGTRAEVIDKYRQHLFQCPHLLALLPTLRGKCLGCWCKPEQCHGDVLRQLLDEPLE